MVEPLKPDEVIYNISKPDAVVQVFNELIAKHWNGTRAKFKQQEAVDEITYRMKIGSSDVFANGYLDVEPLYENAGWKVVYEKPGFNEYYPATFTFSKK